VAVEFGLAQGEAIKMTCIPAKLPRWMTYVITLGFYEFWRRANVYAVTDRRVAARHGLITKTEGSLPLFYVQDATIRTFLSWGRVNISTAGGDGGDLETNYLRREDAQKLRRVVLDLAHEARGKAQTGGEK
jgi:membrane protein YdbS with pleckstrin-like domain